MLTALSLDSVSVLNINIKYACTVESHECCAKVTGVSDVILKASYMGMHEAELFKFSGLTINTNLILSAVRAYKGIYSVNLRCLCGICSSGIMFVLIKATRNELGGKTYDQFFDNFGQLNNT